VLRLLQSCSKNSKSWARSLWMLGEFSDRYASEGADASFLTTPFQSTAAFMHSTRALRLVLSRVFLLYRGDNRNRTTLPRTASFWVSAAALANHRMKERAGCRSQNRSERRIPRNCARNSNSPETSFRFVSGCAGEQSRPMLPFHLPKAAADP
jgi:hypothetical protein